MKDVNRSIKHGKIRTTEKEEKSLEEAPLCRLRIEVCQFEPPIVTLKNHILRMWLRITWTNRLSCWSLPIFSSSINLKRRSILPMHISIWYVINWGWVLKLGPRKKKLHNRVIIFIKSIILGPRNLHLQGMKKWSVSKVTSLSHKIFTVLTQENTTPDLCYQSSSLGQSWVQK